MEERVNAPAATSGSRFPDGFRILKGEQEYVTYIAHSSLRVWYSDTPYDYEPHYHSAIEIVVPIRGEVLYTVADFSYRVQSDEVLIIPPNWKHSLSMGEGSARYLLLFEPDSIYSLRDMKLLDSLLSIPVYISEQPEAQSAIRSLLMQTVNCYEKRDFMWNTTCYSYLLQLYARLGQINAQMLQPRHASRDAAFSRTDHELIDSARLYIDQNYMRDITLNDVSRFTGFSRYYFSRLFKQQTGTPFAEYLRTKRVNMASDLLIHSQQPIHDIAIGVGFGSIATFNRVFREAKGCAPTRYREIYGDFAK